MRRQTLCMLGIKVVLASVCLAAAPAASSYRAIEQSIERAREGWSKPDKETDDNRKGWNALFDGLIKDLHTYSTADTESDRLAALGRIHVVHKNLEKATWLPAKELRAELGQWLRPRIRLAWAARKLVDTVTALPAAPSTAVKDNRERWVQFVDHDLERQLLSYNAAPTVAKRLDALKSVRESLGSLDSQNRSGHWAPAVELQSALDGLIEQPNFNIRADFTTLRPLFETNLITTGPVKRKGYTAQVTSGPKTGFGLIPCDDGIAFYNRQKYTSVTPIWDFNQQMAADPQGQRATQMYYFSATSIDQAEITIATAIRSNGLSLRPTYSHDVTLQIGSAPVAGGNLTRFFASIVGYDQQAITNRVWEGALPKMKTNIAREALEEGTTRTSEEAAQRNVAWSRYLHGGGRVSYGNFRVEELSLVTHRDGVTIHGTAGYGPDTLLAGAELPRPVTFAGPAPGITADLHVGSILTNLASGYFGEADVKSIDNLMFARGGNGSSSASNDGAAASPSVKVTRNADFAAYLAAVESIKDDPDAKKMAIRLHRPTQPPEFSVDSHGNLVAIVHDFQVEVPFSAQAAKGAGIIGMPPAKVLRISAPRAEVTVALSVLAPSATEPLRLTGKIENFDPGPGLKILALNEDEKQGTALTNFTAALVVVAIKTKVQAQPLDIPLRNVQIPGFAIRAVSPVDPSGWIRVTLERTGDVTKVSRR